MLKKIFLLSAILLVANNVFAYEVPKNEEYYKAQIQNQRLLYNATGLINAIQKGNAEAVDLFMKAGFDPNTSYAGTPALIFAIYQKQPKCVDVLLKAGADPETTVPPMFVSARSMNSLNYAINKKSSDMVKSLIENNVDVNKKFNGKYPINRALAKKQPVIVEMLLKAGAKPDEKTFKLVKKSKDEYIKDLFANYKEVNEK